MKTLFSIRSLATYILLLIAASALIAGIRAGVLDVNDAAFWPVAAFAVTLSYLLGSTTISTRRVWGIITISGLLVIYIEAARIYELLVDLAKAIPPAEFEFLRSLLAKRPADLSTIQSLWMEISGRSNLFFTNLFGEIVNSAEKQPTLREVLWDLPLLFLPAWAGWWTRKYNNILTALGPSLALHGYILYYTDQSGFSLQVAAFALILLLGINQKWNLSSQKSETSEKTTWETYSTLVIMSFALAIGAGLMPSISIEETTQKLKDRVRFSETLGLEKAIVKNYNLSSSGLPLEHLVGQDPSTLRTIVFIAKTGELPFLDPEARVENLDVPRHYWRWVTYDIYNGQSWTSSPSESISYLANESLFSLKDRQYKTVHQTIQKSSSKDDHLYWTGLLLRANQPFQSTWRVSPQAAKSSANPVIASDMLGSLTQKQTYSADSIVPIVSEEMLRSSSQIYPVDIRRRYLSLPTTTPARVLELARSLTLNMDNPYDKARAIEAYLRTYPYLLKVPPPPAGHDTADYFLFDLKTGYCDYYATSMVVLARAVGLPARLVIGYSSGEYDIEKGEYVVRELHAHSWVEIYFSGVGWVEFEPTANEPAITLPGQTPQQQVSTAPLTHKAEAFAKKGFFAQPNYFPFMSVLAIIILFMAWWFLRTQGLLGASDSIGSMYQHVYQHGATIYKDTPIYETPSVFASQLKKKLGTQYRFLRAAAVEIDVLTNLYLKETYSAHPIDEQEHRQAVKTWRKLSWRLLYARMVARLSRGQAF